MMLAIRGIGALLFGTILAFGTNELTAGVLVEYSADAGGTPVSDTVAQETGSISFDGGDGSTRDSFDPDNPTVQSASFILTAQHGYLRAASLAVLSGGQSYAASASVSALAAFEDELTIDSPGLTGQNGMVSVSMLFDGLLSEAIGGFETDHSNARARVEYSFWADSSLGNPSEGAGLGLIDEPDGYAVNNLLTLEIPFVYGEAFTIGAVLDTSASVQMPNFPGSTSAISDFADTASWQGINWVQNSTGEEIDDYTATSASNTDYTGPIGDIDPIPEPSTLTLLLFGAGVLVWRRRG